MQCWKCFHFLTASSGHIRQLAGCLTCCGSVPALNCRTAHVCQESQGRKPWPYSEVGKDGHPLTEGLHRVEEPCKHWWHSAFWRLFLAADAGWDTKLTSVDGCWGQPWPQSTSAALVWQHSFVPLAPVCLQSPALAEQVSVPRGSITIDSSRLGGQQIQTTYNNIYMCIYIYRNNF